MSSSAPPPPPEDTTGSPESTGSEPTATFPTRASTVTDEPTSSFDADVLAEPTVTVSAPAATRSMPQTERPQLRGAPSSAGPRRVRMSITHVDPWSVMKLAFLLSVAIGIMTVVAAALVWSVLDSMEVFGKISELLEELRVPKLLELMQFVEFDSVLSISVLISVLNIVLMTALSAIMALLYNITAALVGGVHITMMDE